MSILKRITKSSTQVAERALRKGDLDGALAALESGLKKRPDDVKQRRQLADVYAKAGRFEDAVRELQVLANAFAAEGLLLKATSACKAILDIDEDHEEAAALLARLSRQTGGGLVKAPLSTGDSAPSPPTEHDEILEADDVAEEILDDELSHEEPPYQDLPQQELSADELSHDDVLDEVALDDHDADDLIVAETASEHSDDDHQLDLALLPDLPLFSALPRHALEELLSDLDEWRVPSGAAIVRQGEVGSSFFVIVGGEVRVERDGQALATLGRGEFFGEMAMLSSHPRTASVVATSECELFEIKRARMDHIMSRYASVERVLLQFCRERLLGDVLRSSLFAGLDERLVREMVRAFRTKRVPMGQRVVTQGMKGRGLYVILSGELDVARETDGEVRTVSQLSAGDVVGEMSLLYKEPTSASVTALTHATLLALSQKGFADFCKRHPVMKKRLAALASTRK